MKKLFILAAAIMLSIPVMAQSAKVVTTYNYLKHFDRDTNDVDALRKAAAAINDAAEHENTSAQGKTWYYRGLVYQNIYQNSQLVKEFPGAAQTAYESYRKALEVGDTKFKNNDEVLKNLKILTIIFHNSGVEAYNKNDFTTAYNHFNNNIELQDFLKKQGEEADADAAVFMAALSAERVGNNEIAKQNFTRLIKKNYDNPGMYQVLANIHKSEGDTTQALRVLQQGIKNHPSNLGLIIDELNIYLAGGKQKEAISRLEKAIEIDSLNSQLYYALGVANDNLGNKEAAEAHYNRSIALNPENFDVLNNLGALYYNQAIEINKTLNTLDLKDQKKYDALTKERNALYTKALPYFEKAAQLSPENIPILDALREIYARMERYEESNKVRDKIKQLQSQK